MSLVKISNNGWLISHSDFLNEIYKSIFTQDANFRRSEKLFKISTPYKKRSKKKRANEQKDEVKSDEDDSFHKQVRHVEELFQLFSKEVNLSNKEESKSETFRNNTEALNIADLIYNESEKYLIRDTEGSNFGASCIQTLNSQKYVFPENCKFYCKEVSELSKFLKDDQFDLILLDPPWWNKYIRRKRKFSNSYNMMYNEDLENIALGNHLKSDGLVVVWCTNSQQHYQALVETIFPKWGVEYLGKWYWVKVTEFGEPICDFSTPPRKQPFEHIIFGAKNTKSFEVEFPTDKLVVSVPSALHSHKPPLIRLLEPFLPDNPQCLEIFARYLVPNWTSFGNEVLKFQHESFFKN